MNRIYKPLATAILAMLATAVIAAPSASAEGFVFGSETDVTTLKGGQEGEDVFTTTAGSVKCKSITYSGKASESRVVTVELEPSYSSCTSSSATVTVDVNGCKYRLKAKTESGPPYEGTMDIVCPTGKEITVTASLFGTNICTVHIPAQTGLGSITYANSGSGSTQDITASLNITKMKYSHTAGSGFGACTTGSAENATYEGTALIEGEGEGEVEGEKGEAGLGINLATAGTHMEIEPDPKMDFTKDAVGTKKIFKIMNYHVISWNIERINIVENQEKTEESKFAIIRNTCPAVILTLGSCELEVEMKVKSSFRWLHFKYGGDWWWSAEHIVKRDIAS